MLVVDHGGTIVRVSMSTLFDFPELAISEPRPFALARGNRWRCTELTETKTKTAGRCSVRCSQIVPVRWRLAGTLQK